MKSHPSTIRVNKADFEIWQFPSGCYGICQRGTQGSVCVYGGDSSNDEDYDLQLITSIYDEWDGTLYYGGVFERGYEIQPESHFNNFNKSKAFPEYAYVNKEDFEIYDYSSGYYGITEKGTHGSNCVYGGDSAHEDDYNIDRIKAVYELWDGNLHYYNSHGYKIDLVD
jgi:hypothetical protein